MKDKVANVRSFKLDTLLALIWGHPIGVSFKNDFYQLVRFLLVNADEKMKQSKHKVRYARIILIKQKPQLLQRVGNIFSELRGSNILLDDENPQLNKWIHDQRRNFGGTEVSSDKDLFTSIIGRQYKSPFVDVISPTKPDTRVSLPTLGDVFALYGLIQSFYPELFGFDSDELYPALISTLIQLSEERKLSDITDVINLPHNTLLGDNSYLRFLELVEMYYRRNRRV